MRIRLLWALSGVMKHYKAGHEVDWEDADALRLISCGAAERIEDAPPAPVRRGKKAVA